MLISDKKGVRLTRERFLDVLNVEKFCPVNPAVAIQAMMLADNGCSNFAAIARVVEADSALAGRLIGTANLVARRGIPLRSLDRAVGALGIRATRSLLVSCALVSHLSRDGLSGLNWRRFWQFQLCCAVAARRISGGSDAEAFAAALLQNIGVLALARIGGPPQILEVNRDPGGMDTLIDVELQRFGVTHGQAGAWLLDTWGVSGPLSEHSANHVPSWSETDHQASSGKAPHAGLLAEWIAAVATGFGAEHATTRLAQWMPRRLEMRFADLSGLIRDVQAEAEQLAGALRVEIVRFDDADILFEQATRFLAESTFHLVGQLRIEAPLRSGERSRRILRGESQESDGGDREPTTGVLTPAAFETLINARCRRAENSRGADGSSALIGLIQLAGFTDAVAREDNAVGARLLHAAVKALDREYGERNSIGAYEGGVLAILSDAADSASAQRFAEQMRTVLVEDSAFAGACDANGVEVRVAGVFVDDWADLDASTVLGLCEHPFHQDGADVHVQPLAVAAMRVLVAD